MRRHGREPAENLSLNEKKGASRSPFWIAGKKDQPLLRDMMEAVSHRGPDDAGEYSDEHVSLGMRRLKIIDLETGNQPIANENKKIWVIFNGEIIPLIL